MADDFRQSLTEVLPDLRAYARALESNHARADDIVQEALMKAWTARDRFEPGTNLKAWLFAIIRNVRISQFRKTKWETEDVDGVCAAAQSAPATQELRMTLLEVEEALRLLPEEQREAIVMIGASGLTYEEASAVAGVSVEALKSRVARGRRALAELLRSGRPLRPRPAEGEARP